MKISLYTGGLVQTNGYLVETPDGNLLIDAPEGIAEWITRRGVRVDDVLLTHQHIRVRLRPGCLIPRGISGFACPVPRAPGRDRRLPDLSVRGL